MRHKEINTGGYIMENTMVNIIYKDYSIQGPEWISLAQKAFKARKEAKLLSLYEKELTKQLVALAGGKNSRGDNLILQKIERAGAVNYSIIPQLKKINLDIFRKDPVTTWSLKEIK